MSVRPAWAASSPPTGNGRCNITNTGAAVAHYHGEAPDFAAPALEYMPVADTLALFRGIGLLTREEYGGRVYPLSNSANSVTDTLRFALEAEGVQLISGDRVRALTTNKERFCRGDGERNERYRRRGHCCLRRHGG